MAGTAPGATPVQAGGTAGVRFALRSDPASAVELCLFDPADPGSEVRRVPMVRSPSGLWEAFVPGERPGRPYGYRVHGPYAPAEGSRFNPAKLLLDPHARALTVPQNWNDALRGSASTEAGEDDQPDPHDSAAWAPRSVVVDPRFDWGSDARPRTPWERTVLYECHVRGLTVRHPAVPPECRGRYLGLAAPPVLDHLRALGITAVELLPIHASFPEGFLARRGLTNYWGYNTMGFFAPDARFASGDRGEQFQEFRKMVRALHEAGIEVILDVVYNHTAEGDERGPTLSFRGIDNAGYYRLRAGDPRRYHDVTGCGNTLDLGRPLGMELVLDSLRFWATEMRVDGFRLDLAAALLRGADGSFEPDSGLLQRVASDPDLTRCKWIAEPWDTGPGGYRAGHFPDPWREWNDLFRDGVRRFWRGDPGRLPDLAARLSGSADRFGRRGAASSIHFVTCHDGFTLHDLVSYDAKHNDDNHEGNRDGTTENWSHNWGAEGEPATPEVRQLRDQVARSLLATLALSRGVPMLGHGDEMGRTQRGNNNAYCQDGPMTWVDWGTGARARDLLAFARQAMALRAELAAARETPPERWAWLHPSGRPMAPGEWMDPRARALAVLTVGPDSRAVLLLLNGGFTTAYFRLPLLTGPGAWRERLNSARPGERPVVGEGLDLPAHSLALLDRPPPPGPAEGRPGPPP